MLFNDTKGYNEVRLNFNNFVQNTGNMENAPNLGRCYQWKPTKSVSTCTHFVSRFDVTDYANNFRKTYEGPLTRQYWVTDEAL